MKIKDLLKVLNIEDLEEIITIHQTNGFFMRFNEVARFHRNEEMMNKEIVEVKTSEKSITIMYK